MVPRYLDASLDPPMPEENEDGVDVSQIHQLLDMEPIDRVRYVQAFVRSIWRIQTQQTGT